MKKIYNMKTFNDFPFLVHILILPYNYVVAILKLMIVIPLFIISKCNTFLKTIK